MTDNEKLIVLNDLCQRFVFGDTEVMVEYHPSYNGKMLSATKDCPQKLELKHIKFLTGDIDDSTNAWVGVKPILRKFDTITEKELIELFSLEGVKDLHWEVIFGDRFHISYKRGDNDLSRTIFFKDIYCTKNYEWLIKHNFDYNFLIEKHLAYENLKFV